MFYFQNFIDLVPDIICLSKTLGGGKSSISCLVIDDKTYNDAYGKINETFLHTTTYNGFGEESVTALAALNILSRNDFQKKVESLSNLISIKLKELQLKHSKKIQEIKGNGILNGIIFKSFSTSLGSLLEKIPSHFIKDRSFFLKKITATAISCEMYEKHNILTSINDSSFSNHLCVSPSLVMGKDEVNYFFESLDSTLNNNLDLKSIELIVNFIKSKI